MPGPTGTPPGEDDEDMEFASDIPSALDPVRGRRSIAGCWSTGKKLHSFFNRMQLEHRF